MGGLPTIYCPACHALRAIKDWHEQREMFVIELDRCGHVVRRSARLEWRVKKAVA